MRNIMSVCTWASTLKINNNTQWVQISHQLKVQFCIWSIKLTYGCNLWLVVSLKWIMQEQGFISSRQRLFWVYSILIWLILLFERRRFDTHSQLDHEDEYKRLSLKAATNCEETKLGRIFLGQTNDNNSLFAHKLHQKSLHPSSRTQISWKIAQCCPQLWKDKKIKPYLEGRTKY